MKTKERTLYCIYNKSKNFYLYSSPLTKEQLKIEIQDNYYNIIQEDIYIIYEMIPSKLKLDFSPKLIE